MASLSVSALSLKGIRLAVISTNPTDHQRKLWQFIIGSDDSSMNKMHVSPTDYGVGFGTDWVPNSIDAAYAAVLTLHRAEMVILKK